MSSRHTFGRFTGFQFSNYWNISKLQMQKACSGIWRQILLGGISFLVAEPAWSDLVIAPKPSVPDAPQLVSSASIVPTTQTPHLAAPSKREVLLEGKLGCQTEPVAHSCPKNQIAGTPVAGTPVDDAVLPNDEAVILDFPPPEITASSKSGLTSTIDSYQASDLADFQETLTPWIPQKNFLQDDMPSSWAIATTFLPSLETIASRPVIDDVAESNQGNHKHEETSPPSVVAQEFSLPADPANPAEMSLEDCPIDPDLGCLRIPLPSAAASTPPVLYLIPRLDFFQSNNILLGIDPVNDGLIRPSLTLLALPALGPNTYLVASVEGALNRYFRVSEFSYDELRLRAGIFHRLSPTMTAEIGWTNQQLFIASDKIFGFPNGTRFLNDHAIRLEISRRDQLADRLSLSSFYQFRAGFAQPEDRSRILNVLFLSLNYELTSAVQLGLDYQFAAANFTVTPRTDIYHQILGRITLNAFRNTQLSLYGGFSLGSSTVPSIDFNSYVVGVSMSVNLVLF